MFTTINGYELLELSIAIAPYLKKFIGKDMMVAVTDREKILAYVPGEVIDDPCEIGSKIPEGEPMLEAIATGKSFSANVSKEVYGFAFKSTMTPIFDEQGNVIGCVCVGTSMEAEDEVITISDNLYTAMQQVSAAVEEIAASAADITDNQRNMSKMVGSVGESSAQITNVLGFIKTIADQTKMLGLNAAIEAARVGAAGRGFSVVAEEIRKLSDESRKTVNQVHKFLEEINDSIAATVGASQKTLQAGEEQAAATQEVSAAIQELSSIAQKLKIIANTL